MPLAEITQLLQAWNEGDQGAIEKLVPLVYDELHRLAQRYMADERPEHTLQTTELVNEGPCGTGTDVVKTDQINILARTMFRHLEEIDHAEKP